MSKRNLVILIVILTLLIDQISKIYIKTHFYLGEDVKVLGLDWFHIRFVENYGTAWGFKFWGKTGKIILTLFRFIAVGGIIYWLIDIIKRKAHNGVIIAISLILSGAIGNIIDSVFYGVIFNTPYGTEVATLFSDKPYAELFHGKVVDMLYFPFYESESFTFFNAIFNVADSWISIGVVLLFLFSKHAFPEKSV